MNRRQFVLTSLAGVVAPRAAVAGRAPKLTAGWSVQQTRWDGLLRVSMSLHNPGWRAVEALATRSSVPAPEVSAVLHREGEEDQVLTAYLDDLLEQPSKLFIGPPEVWIPVSREKERSHCYFRFLWPFEGDVEGGSVSIEALVTTNRGVVAVSGERLPIRYASL